MRVRFLQRCGAYFPGADPVLNDPDELKRLLAAGICEPFVELAVVAEPVAEVVDEPTEVEPEAALPEPSANSKPHRGGRRSR